MLKGIPDIISPEMMKALMEMGHGDEIVLADANFPAVTCTKNLIRSDGHQLPTLLEAILKFFPLDKSVGHPVVLMAVNSNEVAPTIWVEYRRIIQKHDDSFTEFEHIERFEFYKRAKRSFGVVISGDTTFRANIILKKGVIRD